MNTRDRDALLHSQEIEAIKINQDIIKRMANNSQHIKNSFLVLSGAILTFGTKVIAGHIPFILGFIIVALSFWYMDAKYLRLERLFRKHHNAIVDGSVNYLDQFSFNITKYKESNIFKLMFNNFTMLIYPIMIVVIGIIVLW